MRDTARVLATVLAYFLVNAAFRQLVLISRGDGMNQVYEFIEVSAPDAERAWRMYCEDRDVVASALVSFIPASGGAFLVAQEIKPRHWWSSFLDAQSFRERDLNDFRDFLSKPGSASSRQLSRRGLTKEHHPGVELGPMRWGEGAANGEH